MPRRDWRPGGVLTKTLPSRSTTLSRPRGNTLVNKRYPTSRPGTLAKAPWGTDRHPFGYKRGAHIEHLEQIYLSNLSLVRSMRLVRACAASHSSERASWCSPGTCLVPPGLSVLAPQRRQIAIRPLVSGR
jgi:hypothetical protein